MIKVPVIFSRPTNVKRRFKVGCMINPRTIGLDMKRMVVYKVEINPLLPNEVSLTLMTPEEYRNRKL